jgi:hypothetical protein
MWAAHGIRRLMRVVELLLLNMIDMRISVPSALVGGHTCRSTTYPFFPVCGAISAIGQLDADIQEWSIAFYWERVIKKDALS